RRSSRSRLRVPGRRLRRSGLAAGRFESVGLCIRHTARPVPGSFAPGWGGEHMLEGALGGRVFRSPRLVDRGVDLSLDLGAKAFHRLLVDDALFLQVVSE